MSAATILGTLVHRALAAPAITSRPIARHTFNRPIETEEGTTWESVTRKSLRAEQIEAAQMLTDFLGSDSASDDYSPARLMADQGGHTMSLVVDELFEPGMEADRKWILARLVPTVTAAAAALYRWEQKHFDTGRTAAWGECTVAPPGGGGKASRADTILTTPRRVVVLDYKTTSSISYLKTKLRSGIASARKRVDEIPDDWWPDLPLHSVGVAILCSDHEGEVQVLIGGGNRRFPTERYTYSRRR